MPRKLLRLLPALIAATASTALAAERASHDITTYPLVWREPGMERVEVRAGIEYGRTASRSLALDLYLPADRTAGERLPLILFLNGVGDGPRGAVKDWAIYRTWLQAAAARGFAAAMGETDASDVAGSLRQFLAAPAQLARFGVDAGRVGTFAVSANVSTSFPLLMEASASPGVRAAVFYYGTGEAERYREDLPVLHVLARLDGPNLVAGERRMWERAREAGAPWTMIDAPRLPHAFDALVTSPDSFAVIAQTFAFWEAHLTPHPAPASESPAEREARLGLAAGYGQQWDAAASIYERIVARDPGDAGAWGALAWAQQGTNRLAEAEASLEKAIGLDPDDRFAVRRLGVVQAKRERCAQAAKTLVPVFSEGNDAMAASEVGLCFLRAGDAPGAVPHLERAATASPAPHFRYNLACALALSGEKDRAIAALEPLAAVQFGTRKSWSEDTDLAGLRGDARFEALLARLNP